PPACATLSLHDALPIYHVLKVDQTRGDPGLVFVDIQPRPGDPPLPKRAHERRFVDERAARGVDEVGRRFHPPELLLPDEVVSVGDRKSTRLNSSHVKIS